MKEYPTPRPRPAFVGIIKGPADMSSKKLRDYLDASAEVGDVPPTVCIRHGRHVPCRTGQRFDQRYPAADDCLLSSHPAVVSLVDAYQRDTDGVRYDFEHVAKSWIYLMKREGNW